MISAAQVGATMEAPYCPRMRWHVTAAAMTSSSNYDIRRNLIDAPSSDSQLPASGGSDLALARPGGLDDRRGTTWGDLVLVGHPERILHW